MRSEEERREYFSSLQPTKSKGTNWYIVEDLGDDWYIEVYPLANPDTNPSRIRLVKLGPRGGILHQTAGTVTSLREEISQRLRLINAIKAVDPESCVSDWLKGD